jgi:ParB-like chromosome segregation protein Spo0J
MNIQTVAIQNLKLDPNNARKHSEENLRVIQESLKQFGQRKPIVVWQETVVAGNGTLLAAKSLGWKEIQIALIPDHWEEAKVKAYALADNRSAELAEWDKEVLAAQLIDLEELDFRIEDFGFQKVDQPDEQELADAFEGLGKEKGEMETMSFTLHNSQADLIRSALDKSKALGEFDFALNSNSNGNAIFRIVEAWLGNDVG